MREKKRKEGTKNQWDAQRNSKTVFKLSHV